MSIEQIQELRARYFIHLTGVANPIRLSDEQKKIINESFDFFQREIEDYGKCIKAFIQVGIEQQAKISHLQATLEAADEVMGRTTWNQGDNYHEALEKYNQLKTKSQS